METESVSVILTIDDITNHHLACIIKCLNIVIQAEIPEPKDVAFLMEVMTKVAKQQKKKDNVMFKLRLDDKSSLGIWHSLNIALRNDLLPNQGHQAVASELLSKLAIKIDQAIAMKTPPEKKLELV